jgi:hypothetical protein
MLKITIFRTNQRCRLVLDGKLVCPWVAELKREWDDARLSAPELTLIVDLRNVTYGGVLNRHVLHQLAGKRTTNIESFGLKN